MYKYVFLIIIYKENGGSLSSNEMEHGKCIKFLEIFLKINTTGNHLLAKVNKMKSVFTPVTCKLILKYIYAKCNVFK